MRHKTVSAAIVLCACVLIVTASAMESAMASASAQQSWPVQDPPPETSGDKMINIKELDWMVGHWQGEAFGGVCEEVWSPMSAGTMVGSFKLYVGDEVKFYEIMTITPDSSGPLMRVKHFGPDLKGWEEKDESAEFRFTRAGDREVQFEGLTYSRTGEDSLRIVVTVTRKDGTAREEVIDCGRK